MNLNKLRINFVLKTNKNLDYKLKKLNFIKN